MMLCAVCLLENQAEPARAVTYFSGTAVCREHVMSVGNADALSVSYRLRGIGERLRERTNNANSRNRPASTEAAAAS
jgi:hypothetical protein